MKRFTIVDKDPKIIQEVRTICEEYFGLHYIEFFINSDEEILNQFLKYTPDLIFIDLDNTLKDTTAFFLNILQCLPMLPNFIGLSITKEKAFDAFQFEMSGFLLKPLNELNIRKSIMKYQKKVDKAFENIICLKSHKDYHYLAADDILYLEADNNTTDFYLLGGKKISAYKTLKTFEQKLPENFLRIHKSYIINSLHVSRINYTRKKCSLRDLSYNIPFTRTFIDNIRKINDNLSLKAQLFF